MNMDQVHNPARLDGESLREYHARQSLSKRLATHAPVVHNKGTYFRPETKSAQRKVAKK
jgi:hypothetical protein